MHWNRDYMMMVTIIIVMVRASEAPPMIDGALLRLFILRKDVEEIKKFLIQDIQIVGKSRALRKSHDNVSNAF
jgi:hypothetical protein